MPTLMEAFSLRSECDTDFGVGTGPIVANDSPARYDIGPLVACPPTLRDLIECPPDLSFRILTVITIKQGSLSVTEQVKE